MNTINSGVVSQQPCQYLLAHLAEISASNPAHERFYALQRYPMYSPGSTCSPLFYCGKQTRRTRAARRLLNARLTRKPSHRFSNRPTSSVDDCSRASSSDSVRSGLQHPLMPHTNVDAIPFYPKIFLGECERWILHIKE
ncbi:unnamed protein product [Bursaphelenchus okinawaensis]|uniref:Uncharacterized protein n=1 Tax=Bursaphelenchus okinawaensis TaxID=465554 RepID=A0A811JRU3_9BILA|nr:unnamed protein product [Bursaphelenchus okinawaensis]CAG9080151.1 unnamed protein product [Bursaphelenchus okinawaensis]